jgi:UMF1 family MFS transporter
MVLAGLFVPIAGALADRTGRAKTYLWWFTVLCCGATVGIGLAANDTLYDGKNGVIAPGYVILLVVVLFGLANLAYQMSLVFYNTMLPTVASPDRQGRVSGLGVGLGYLGVVFALPLAQYAYNQTGSMRAAFYVAGATFFVSALPLFVVVPGQRRRNTDPVTPAVVGRQFREVARTLGTIRRIPPVLFFFIGNFLCVDVVNTLLMWTRPYLIHGAGFSSEGSIQVLMLMSVSAFVLGMGMGWLTDKMGSKRTMLAATGSLGLCIVTAGLLDTKWLLVAIITVFGSGGLAGVWVAGRKFLLEIAPEDKVGEFFGIYGITIKLSVFGCTLYAGLADWSGSHRTALLSLLAPLAVGIAFLGAAKPIRIAEGTEDVA